MPILDRINSPKDLRALSIPQLKQLAKEARQTILSTVLRNGGHLSSNLGMVEVTIALHYVYDCPQDKLLFDVGHQCYTHKLLTGRREQFATLRTAGGLSGFPRIEESPYDAFGVGHSATAVSAALGYARARDNLSARYKVAAVVGDGAFMDGPCMEAINDAGHSGTALVIVLNDNEMSIARNVGALSGYLNKLRSNPAYWRIKEQTGDLLRRIPFVGKALYEMTLRFKNCLKYLLVHGEFFEDLGFTYLGPVDGHNLEALIDTLTRARALERPVLVHAVTKKGKGYPPAEQKPDQYHGVPPQPAQKPDQAAPVSYSKQVGDTLESLALADGRVCVITAAMPDGTGVAGFGKRFPKRFYDVGIAEEHAVTLACGLAAGGMAPFFVVYSTFLQRGYDQIIHDMALQKLPVRLLISHSGLVGEDGATHNGVFDLSYLMHIPNLTILAPDSAQELAYLIRWAHGQKGPIALRYPKEGAAALYEVQPMEQGVWQTVKSGKDATVLAVGSMVAPALQAAAALEEKGWSVGVVNCRQLKPLPEAALAALANRPMVTVEENVLSGGFGAAVALWLAAQGKPVKLLPLGLPDAFIAHGSRQSQLEACGLTAQALAQRIGAFLKEVEH